ncbi:MAG: hypothetical protein R3336_05455 [Phycisphaeraceae bacterium]|nr:hypothetical protein [Phycisphaeraceae bacterium]
MTLAGLLVAGLLMVTASGCVTEAEPAEDHIGPADAPVKQKNYDADDADSGTDPSSYE